MYIYCYGYSWYPSGSSEWPVTSERPCGTNQSIQNSALRHSNAYARAVKEEVTPCLMSGSAVPVAVTCTIDPFKINGLGPLLKY